MRTPLLLMILLAGLFLAAVCGAYPQTGDAAGRRRASWEAFTARVEGGDAEAQFRMARLLETGFDTVPRDTVRALRLLRASAAAGHAPAEGYLGWLYGEGRLVTLDPDSALVWTHLGAEGGDIRSAYNLAFLLLPDTAALPWLRRAADAGLPQALTLMADQLAAGEILPRDSAQAAALYTRALERGWPDAEARLLNLIGPGLDALAPAQLLEGAIRYRDMRAYTIAAEHLLRIPAGTPQTPAAYTMLGHAYARAEGVPYNYTLANDYFDRAAALGDPEARRIVDEHRALFPN